MTRVIPYRYGACCQAVVRLPHTRGASASDQSVDHRCRGRLFAATGYVATTIQDIADEAEVAVQTVYAVFGNKRELLRQVLEAAVTGDAEQTPLMEHARVRVMAQEPDGRRRAEMDAAMVAEIGPRIAPIAPSGPRGRSRRPQFAATAKQITARRRADMIAAARLLAGPDSPEMDLEDAIGTADTISGPEVFARADRGTSVVFARALRAVGGRHLSGPSSHERTSPLPAAPAGEERDEHLVRASGSRGR